MGVEAVNEHELASDPKLMAVLSRNSANTKRIFGYFSSQGQGMKRRASIASINSTSSGSKADDNTTMSFRELEAFCKAFRIVPDMLDRVELQDLFAVVNADGEYVQATLVVVTRQRFCSCSTRLISSVCRCCVCVMCDSESKTTLWICCRKMNLKPSLRGWP